MDWITGFIAGFGAAFWLMLLIEKCWPRRSGGGSSRPKVNPVAKIKGVNC